MSDDASDDEEDESFGDVLMGAITDSLGAPKEPDPEADPTPEPEADPTPDPEADSTPEPESAGATPEPEAARAAPTGPAVEIKGLTLAVPGLVLLKDADLTVARGERVLLVGPSGSGKSVLLRLLTGLLPESSDYSISGEVRVCGHSLLDPQPTAEPREAVGIVFQDHALLDELTARGNLEFARDHSSSPLAAEATARALTFLEAHGIGPDARVGNLSGGQKQRVAVARALARDPALLFYDEPTSALDPRSARAVSALIAETSEGFGKTSVVVTHDYPPFRGSVDRVIFLDTESKTLREIGFDELDGIMSAPLPATPPAEPTTGSPGSRALDGALAFVAATPGALLTGLRAIPLALVPVGAHPKWFLRWFVHYSRLVFAGSAIPYNVIAGVIAGFVATYFTYKFLPRPELTEPLILDDILPALGFAIYRVVVPVLVTILVAGRTGAALASDFGNRVYHHQTQAMKSLGAPPRAYLGSAALWASLIGILVVGAIAFWAATLTSLAVFTVIQEDLTPFYWSAQFWRKLEPFQFGVIGKGWHWVLTKLLASAVGVCAISYAIGTRPKRTTADVSRGITLSVYWGTVFVLLVHFVCAFFEFERPLR